MKPSVPKRLYLERWPESTGREDLVHYERTGYGVDVATGETSTIHVYVLEPVRRARVRGAKA